MVRWSEGRFGIYPDSHTIYRHPDVASVGSMYVHSSLFTILSWLCSQDGRSKVMISVHCEKTDQCWHLGRPCWWLWLSFTFVSIFSNSCLFTLLNLCIANGIVLLSISGVQYTPFPGSKKGWFFCWWLAKYSSRKLTLEFFSPSKSAIASRMFCQPETFLYLRCMVSTQVPISVQFSLTLDAIGWAHYS